MNAMEVVMKYYLAPMEGITGFVFRNAYHDYFAPMDKYFTPFISPNQNICFTPREYRDICPENNKIPNVVPQILTNKAEDFIKTSKELKKMGYGEVNLNLGCPSKTAKRKGAGFLMEPDRLKAFFDRIFENPCVRISVKTRLGMYETEEFLELLPIFNKYPIDELIIHPRVGKELYSGVPHRDMYFLAEKKSLNPLCYNGDLYCVEDVRGLSIKCLKEEGAEYGQEEKKTGAFMFGRGILRDPWLVAKCRQGQKDSALFSDVGYIREFSERLFSDYAQYMGEKNAMFRMKELWFYLIESFADSDANRKKLKKVQDRRGLNLVLQGLCAVFCENKNFL